MSVLFVVIPLALVIAAVAVGAFVWVVRTGQFDDLDSPPVRMLFDDDPVRPDEPARASVDGVTPRASR
ncbi:MAG: cbb3-type cytochrome oxidase assembly protein CcoS [Planctomycetota bacterium]